MFLRMSRILKISKILITELCLCNKESNSALCFCYLFYSYKSALSCLKSPKLPARKVQFYERYLSSLFIFNPRVPLPIRITSVWCSIDEYLAVANLHISSIENFCRIVKPLLPPLSISNLINQYPCLLALAYLLFKFNWIPFC